MSRRVRYINYKIALNAALEASDQAFNTVYDRIHNTLETLGIDEYNKTLDASGDYLVCPTCKPYKNKHWKMITLKADQYPTPSPPSTPTPPSSLYDLEIQSQIDSQDSFDWEWELDDTDETLFPPNFNPEQGPILEKYDPDSEDTESIEDASSHGNTPPPPEQTKFRTMTPPPPPPETVLERKEREAREHHSLLKELQTNKQMTLQRDIVSIDLETTGLDIREDRVITISLLKVRTDGSKDFCHYEMNPECNV